MVEQELKALRERAREIYAAELRRSAPQGEYAARTVLSAPSEADERVFRAIETALTAAEERAGEGGFRPLKQRILHNPPESYGDCQRTCLAMVLGMDPEDVPHFADPREYPPADARRAERAWLAQRGLGYVQMPLPGSYGWDWAEGVMAQQIGTPFIVSGRSPRGPWNHDVVYLDGIIFDPHPDDTGLAGPCLDEANPDAAEWYWINAITCLPSLAAEEAAIRRYRIADTLTLTTAQERIRVLEEAAAKAETALQTLIYGATRAYKARNGRSMGGEADDGEAFDIIHSDITAECSRALVAVAQALSRTAGAAGGDITLREAARDLIRAMRDGQQHVGYRLDLWNALEGCLVASPSISPSPAVAVDGARERFLDLIADAIKFEEQIDEAAIYYTLEFTHESLVPLMNALGLEQEQRPIIVDGEHFPGLETPGEALDRYIEVSAAALDPAVAGKE